MDRWDALNLVFLAFSSAVISLTVTVIVFSWSSGVPIRVVIHWLMGG